MKFIAILFSLILFSCNGDGDMHPEYPKEFRDFYYVDTLGKRFFIFEQVDDPGSSSDDETYSYVTFAADPNAKALFYMDSALRIINCRIFETGMRLVLDSINSIINKGVLYGNKKDENTWEINARLERPLTHGKVSIMHTFSRKRKWLSFLDGFVFPNP